MTDNLAKTDIDSFAESHVEWRAQTREYFRLIEDKQEADSHYLRSQGLEKTLLQLLGEVEEPILDAGCGNRWLFDRLKPKHGVECDFVPQHEIVGRSFVCEDLRSLSFESESFAVVVASLSLMWIGELDQACAELYRVTKQNGRMIVALVHPYFYRTGHIAKDGSFTVTADLSDPFVMDVEIGRKLGPLPYYYRSVCDYFSAFSRAGWTVTDMREWFIDLAHYKEKLGSPREDCPRTDKVPMYLFMECRKGAQ